MGKLVRTLSKDGSIMCAALDMSDIQKEIYSLHGKSTNLVQTAAAASLMGSMMKSESDRLTLHIHINRNRYLAVSDYRGNVKCYTDSTAETAYSLAVTRDLGLKEPHTAQISTVSKNICENITSYYTVSEQIPTVFAFQGDIAYFIQLLPPVNSDSLPIIEKNLETLQNTDAKTVTLNVLAGYNPTVLDQWNAMYFCDCSYERTKNMLISLGRKELMEMPDKNIEVCCNFCDKKYLFSPKEIIEGLI